MGVAAGGVGDEELLLLLDPLGDLRWSFGVEHLLETHLPVSGHGRESGRLIDEVLAVLGDGTLRNIGQHLSRGVFAAFELKQGRGLVDELGVAFAGAEGLVAQHVGDKGDVSLDTVHAHFADGTQSFLVGAFEGAVPGCDLDQQGIVVRRDRRARARGRLVETDTESSGNAVAGDTACVGREVIGRIFGRHTALDRIAIQLNIFLTANADALVGEGGSFGDDNLRADKVNPCHHLGNSVLDLDAGVHFDKVVVLVFIDQELERACVGVADMLCYFDGIVIKLFLDLLRNSKSGSILDHLLVTSLKGTIALIEMNDVAVFVGEDLDLHMLGIDQEFLHEDVVITKRFERLCLDEIVIGTDLFDSVAAAHTASAAACGCLQDDREAEFHREPLGLFAAPQRILGAGRSGDIAIKRHLLGTEFVTHHVQDLGSGSDEFDACLFAGAGEFAVLGQESVAGMDRVAVVHPSEFYDPWNIEIRTQRTLIFPNQIRLVRCCAKRRIRVLVGINRNGLDAQIMTGAEDTHRDFAAVGDQNFVKFCHCHLLVNNADASAADCYYG